MNQAAQGKAWSHKRATFDRNLAVVIGIDHYQHDSIRNLSTAVSDASAIATLLEQQYAYCQSSQNPAVIRLLDEAATLAGLRQLLTVTLPNQHLNQGDRLILYFAGHGLPRSNDDGPEGYLVPHDAEPTDPASFLSMRDVYRALEALNCHHLLVILDCCFAGTFRWAGSRKAVPILETLRREHYYHFIRHPAWQVITSSAHDQEALDVARLQEDNRRAVPGLEQPHSPFALALLEGLQPGDDPTRVQADLFPDGVVTAHELFVYLQTRVKQLSGAQQAPGIYALRREYDKGEFIFTPPKFDPEVELAKALPLNEANNPYRGLRSFEEDHADWFFGRQALIEELGQQLDRTDRPLTVVLGVSGSGKSSLVKAGLIPDLKKQTIDSQKAATKPKNQSWFVLEPMRPSESPFIALAQTLLPIANPHLSDVTTLSQTLQTNPNTLSQTIATWSRQHPGQRLLLVIDQLEELLTRDRDDRDSSDQLADQLADRSADQLADQSTSQSHSDVISLKRWQRFLNVLKIAMAEQSATLRLVLTLRSDFEPRFLSSPLAPYWKEARFPMRAMTSDELRQAIENPALKQALYFEELKDERGNPIGNLVSQLIDEVGQMPGALPLLSFALSELYIYLYKRWREDQSTDRTLRLADYEALGGVAGALTRRATEEYEALDEAQRDTLRRVMLRLVAIEGEGVARRQAPKSEFIYPDPAENDRVQTVIQRFSQARLLVEGSNAQGEAYIEPAHDALVQGWDRLLMWKKAEEENIILQRRLTPAATEWQSVKAKGTDSGLITKTEPLLNRIDRGFYRVENWIQQSVNALTYRFIQQWQRSQPEQSRSRERPAQFLWNANPYLEVLHQILQSSRNWFNQVETEFVQASVLQKRRNLSWRWRIAIGVMLGLTALTLAALIGQRSSLISQIRASRESAEANFRSGQSLDAFLDGLRAARSFQHPLLQVFRPNVRLRQQVEGTLQKAIYSAPEHNRLGNHQGITRSKASPNGQHLVTADEDGMIYVWDWQGQKQAEWQSGQGRIMNLTFSPDSQQIGTAGSDGTARLWDLQGQSIALLQGHTGMVKGINFSPDGQTIATSGTDKTVRLWNQQGQSLAVLTGHQKEVWNVAFSPDGQRLASASDDDTFRIWNLQTRQAQSFPAQQGELHTIEFSPDGQQIATAGKDGRVRLWTAQGQPIADLTGHLGRIWRIEFSRDGQRLASASADGTVRLWSLPDRSPTILQGHQGPVRHVSFSPDGQRLLSSGDDTTARFWELQGQQLLTLSGHQGAINALQFSPDSQYLATSGADATIRLWDFQGNSLAMIPGNLGAVKAIAVSSDGQRLASAQGQTVRLWSQPDQPPIELPGHQGLVSSVQFSPDGQQVVSAGEDGTIRLWTVEGQTIASWQADDQPIWQVAISPTGQQVASAGEDGVVRLWDLQGQPIVAFEGHLGPVFSVAFHPNGQELASSGQDGTVRLWNVQGQRKMNLFQGYDAAINSVAYSPNGQRLISGDSLGKVQLWNLEIQQQSAVWTAHGNSIVRHVSFSPDGQMIATTGDDGAAKLWRLEAFDQLHDRGCALLSDYLNHLKQLPDQGVGYDDRSLCDGIN